MAEKKKGTRLEGYYPHDEKQKTPPHNNLIIYRDNLKALNALLLLYAGRSNTYTSIRLTTPAMRNRHTTIMSISP